MATRKIITFRANDSNELVDIEMPGDVALAELMPDLFKVLFQGAKNKDLQKVILKNEDEEILEMSKTLDEQDVLNSETILIDLNNGTASQKRRALPAKEKRAKTNGKTAAPDTDSASDFMDAFNQIANDRRGLIMVPGKEELQVEHPCLVFEGENRGYMFVLGDSRISIGRPKGSYQPDIDLTEIDTEKVSSRPHGEIEKKDDRFIFKAMKATNGTFLNAEEMATNENRILEDKDVIQFGFTGVKLTFRLPK